MTSATNEATLQRAFEERNARDLNGYLTLYDDRIQLRSCGLMAMVPVGSRPAVGALGAYWATSHEANRWGTDYVSGVGGFRVSGDGGMREII